MALHHQHPLCVVLAEAAPQEAPGAELEIELAKLNLLFLKSQNLWGANVFPQGILKELTPSRGFDSA